MSITTILKATDIDALRQPQLSRAPKFNFVGWLICLATHHRPPKTYYVGTTRRGEVWLVHTCCGRRRKFANVRHERPN